MIRRLTCAAVLVAALAGATAAPAVAEAPRGWEQQVMKVPAAQRLGQGKGITVAVLDSGVLRGHPEFRGRVTTGTDFIGGGARPGQSYWGDHGTAMASSVLRVAPQAKVLDVRVLWDKEDPARKRAEAAAESGGPADEQSMKASTALAKGIRYAADKGARVISMSLGSDEWSLGSDYDELTASAVDYALGKGVVLLASAGNGGSTDPLETDANNTVSYPAAYPGVIAVAAMGPDGARAEFSQVHTYNTIAAPGVDIYAADNGGGYRMGDGTSPACALAAGTVALMLSRNPGLTPRQVRDILVRTAQQPPSGYTVHLGFGLIDAGAAVKAAGAAGDGRTEAAPYKGEKFFGDGPVAPPTTHPEIDMSYVGIGGAAAGVGLLFLVGAALIMRRPRARPAPTPPYTHGPPMGRV
ncbi:S8 family peptidase [Nonomuraea gerenzanensis]|uniref:Serine protease (Membrane protein) n=1 Tax=Nonomuraea gerenzanensis TaxID=93944 RepID=A0A1M4DXM0_9ACTN|nr:S8 family serine peptidase [Nonomuraea gerenzanensis]UBU13645.1 S8 family serine peptidase [Nonomuraea gerenzanensis]SBO91311.1 serine protease (membrane protein) [Nonomuraea gerenzanensis]